MFDVQLLPNNAMRDGRTVVRIAEHYSSINDGYRAMIS